MDKLWKKAERVICRMFGGTRRGPMGRGECDCYHDWLSIEIKCRDKMPAYILEWMEQAEANAEPGKLPLVVWHKVGALYMDSLVFLRAVDFLDWFNGASASGGDEELPFTDLEGDDDE